MNNTLCRMQTHIGIVMLSLLCPLAASCQTDKTANTLDEHQLAIDGKARSFNELISEIHEKSGINIIVEGDPVKKSTDITTSGTLRTVLDKVADAFDYQYTVGRSGSVVLVKRFRSREERPQSHYREFKRVAEDVLSAISNIEIARQGTASLFGDLLTTLSPQQAATLRSGAPLRIAELAPYQVQVAAAAIRTNLLGGADVAWQYMLETISQLPTGSLVLADRSDNLVTQLKEGEIYSLKLLPARGRSRLLTPYAIKWVNPAAGDHTPGLSR